MPTARRRAPRDSRSEPDAAPAAAAAVVAAADEPRRRRLPEERPRQILEAALAEFAERGLGAARLDDIAKRAGLSKGTIYLYFANKEELFRGVVRSVIVTRLEQAELDVAARLTTTGTASERLVEFLREWWAFLSSPSVAALYRLVTGELHRFPDLARFYADEVVIRVLRLLARLLEQGMHAGEFRATDPFVAARMASALVTTHAIWCANRTVFEHVGAMTGDEMLAEITAFVLHALRPATTAVDPAAAPAAASLPNVTSS